MLIVSIPDVHCVHSIQSCKEVILSIQPDLVFIDNNLPDGKGVTFIAELKELLPAARIVMISAMGSLRKEAFKNGADVFIEKPLTQSNLKKALETGISSF